MTNDRNDGVELLKVSCLLTRRPDLTHDQFFDYWTQQHTSNPTHQPDRPTLSMVPNNVEAHLGTSANMPIAFSTRRAPFACDPVRASTA